mmetsp:Transcript_25692/g.65298  ORF Transcript_25692/g.65298 Transcript_25692/m.65298 type:complete len:337 (-) Transcript_25692:1216-2226(-)
MSGRRGAEHRPCTHIGRPPGTIVTRPQSTEHKPARPPPAGEGMHGSPCLDRCPGSSDGEGWVRGVREHRILLEHHREMDKLLGQIRERLRRERRELRLCDRRRGRLGAERVHRGETAGGHISTRVGRHARRHHRADVVWVGYTWGHARRHRRAVGAEANSSADIGGGRQRLRHELGGVAQLAHNIGELGRLGVVERRLALRVHEQRARAVLQQQLHCLETATCSRMYERRDPKHVLDVGVSVRMEQHLEHVLVVEGRRESQRRVPLRVRVVDVGLRINEADGRRCVPNVRRLDERCLAGHVIRHVNGCLVAEQHLDGVRVATVRRHVERTIAVAVG